MQLFCGDLEQSDIYEEDTEPHAGMVRALGGTARRQFTRLPLKRLHLPHFLSANSASEVVSQQEIDK